MKKRLIVTVGVAAVSFGISFFLSYWLGAKDVPPGATDPNAAAEQKPVIASLGGSGERALVPQEQQLAELIRELRRRIEECKRKSKELRSLQGRIETSRGLLKDDADKLKGLEGQVAAKLPQLAEARRLLAGTRL